MSEWTKKKSKSEKADTESPDEVNSTTANKYSSKPLKVLFLSGDTGGGHRASAEALARQFELIFPGSSYDLLDVISDHAPRPLKDMVKNYKHLSSNPSQWSLLYKFTNTKPVEWFIDMHLKILSENAIRERIKSYSPDVVISVHPLMNFIPSLSCEKISQETSTHLPFFTVITDLGSAHNHWFSAAKGTGNSSRAEKIFLASDQIKSIATSRGVDSVPLEKIVQVGLPIRHDFSVQANLLGDRMAPAGKEYQAKIRESLFLEPDHKTVLVMGGGEGVGSLSNIVNSLYAEFVGLDLDATILVVCGRNEKLRNELFNRDWGDVLDNAKNVPLLKRICLFRPMIKNLEELDNEEDTVNSMAHEVKVVPLGFITNMAEYMVAADVLVTKAGPGTIAEANAVSLPIMLTSFLPGQEEGNVEYVKKNDCGTYVSDRFPNEIAHKVGKWLCNEGDLARLSKSSKKAGNPYAAREIAKAIGESTLRWKEVK